MSQAPPSEEEKALIVAGTRATQLGCPMFSPEQLDEKTQGEYNAYDDRIKAQYRTWWYNEQIKYMEGQMTTAGHPIPPAQTYEQIMGVNQQPQQQEPKKEESKKEEPKKNDEDEKSEKEKVKPLKASTINIKKDDVPIPGGDDEEKFPSTSNNELLPDHMVVQAKELGLKEFRIQDLEGNPEYLAKFNMGDWRDKCMVHGEWLQFQLNYFQNEKQNGRYYPALGDKDAWDRDQRIKNGDDPSMSEGIGNKQRTSTMKSPLTVKNPANLDKLLNVDDDESNLLLKKAETVDLASGRFQDPRMMSSKQETGLIGCYACCGKCMMYGCLPCNVCTGGSTLTIPQGYAGIMTSYGKYEKTLGPGFYYYNSCLYQIKKVNIKLQTINIGASSLQTKDGLTMSLRVFLTYKCINPFLMVYAVQNIENVIRDIAGGLLKRLINKNNFRTILIKKQELSEDLKNKLETSMKPGGVEIPFVDITQIVMSATMQEAMSQAAITKKQSESKRITAEAEVKSSKLLKQAGNIMNKNKSSINLKYFETLRDIASNWNHTVILPDGMVYVPQ